MANSDVQSRIRAKVWQAIAENKLDLSALDTATREKLVDVVAASALEAMDDELDGIMAANQDKSKSQDAPVADAAVGDEEILWQGRPFFSVSQHYLVTSERIRVQDGLFGHNFQNIELVRVEDLDYHQSVGERLVNRGDIEIRSHDPSSPLIVLENIKDPEQVYEILRRAVNKARTAHGLKFREEM